MAQIFGSHSKNDKEMIHFFLEAFAGTRVKPVFEEFEAELPTGVNAQKITRDIDASNAVFVILSKNVESLKHTRDWINWECGVARNKPIWVFEPAATLGSVSVVVPSFAHHAVFDISDEWRKYLREIIDSFDDSHVLKTLSATASAGALLNERDRGTGALVGAGLGLLGLLLYSMNRQAFGVQVQCFKCHSIYRVHRFGQSRCAVCNTALIIQAPVTQALVAPAI
jgi:hypothetical protein